MTLGRIGIGLLLTAITGIAAFAAFRLLEARIEADIYRDRLEQVSRDLSELRDLFNEVVRKTAVTELIVRDGQLSVAIRTADGTRKTLPTAFDPAAEIYVDYVVVDGRLWIRRIFDESTPPDHGMLIDPGLADIDWSDDRVSHGKAAYRALHDGRWIVTVTGDGSLGLAPSAVDEPAPLAAPPPVRDYAPISEHVANALRELDAREIALALARRLGSELE